jgi:hypothetical protein
MLLLALGALIAHGCASDGDNERIIMGRNAQITELPFQVQIYWRTIGATAKDGEPPAWQQRHQCGGALIDPQWVVTAAHCFFPSRKPAGQPTVRVDRPELFGVRVGSTSITDAPHLGEDVRVAELVIHPGYVPCDNCPPFGGPPKSAAHAKRFTHDIALVRLAKPVRITPRSEPIRLYAPDRDGPLVVGRDMSVSGWGWASNDAARELEELKMVRPQAGNSLTRAQAEPILQVATVAVVPCTGEDELPTHFCAGGRDGADTCRGDSGGPLVLDLAEGPVLVGITSRRPRNERLCGKGAKRGRVETRYSQVGGEHAAWIASVMKTRR